MEIVIGLIMFSVGAVMASHMYYHCVYPYHPSRKLDINDEQNASL